jgi:hypothetical protein
LPAVSKSDKIQPPDNHSSSTYILCVGVLTESRLQFSGDLLLLALLVFWQPIHLILLYKRHYPLSSVARR